MIRNRFNLSFLIGAPNNRFHQDMIIVLYILSNYPAHQTDPYSLSIKSVSSNYTIKNEDQG